LEVGLVELGLVELGVCTVDAVFIDRTKEQKKEWISYYVKYEFTKAHKPYPVWQTRLVKAQCMRNFSRRYAVFASRDRSSTDRVAVQQYNRPVATRVRSPAPTEVEHRETVVPGVVLPGQLRQ